MTAILWAVFIGLGALDLYLFVVRGPHATLSAEILAAAHQYPMIPFVVGLLCAHLFWSQR